MIVIIDVLVNSTRVQYRVLSARAFVPVMLLTSISIQSIFFASMTDACSVPFPLQVVVISPYFIRSPTLTPTL